MNGLKGQQAFNPGLCPGYKDEGKLALKGKSLALTPTGESGDRCSLHHPVN